MAQRKDSPDTGISFSRRERQIMDILFTLGRASGPEIQDRLPDRPSYSGVRTILRVLERKGHVRHVEEGLRYVYLPVIAREKAKRSAMERLAATFFGGSMKAAAAAFLDPSTTKLSNEDLQALERMIRDARKEKK
ncbi:MAG TPA: BlaI/MecI/CopY family transcriptional regulator [Bryobacteraceae bacterium]|jgi:predicted transcriptional regulator|nr:BlaI/MecI/CopY family transcriptional regulator [Bryobacteraceae bacterium]